MELNELDTGRNGNTPAETVSTGPGSNVLPNDVLNSNSVDPSLSFNSTLPANKEVRIQLALQYCKQQQQRELKSQSTSIGDSPKYSGDAPIAHSRPKQSLRQIAMFFQIPKSTLYDRLKNSKKRVSRDDIDSVSGNASSFVSAVGAMPNDGGKRRSGSLTSPNTASHLIQMKLDPALEEELFLYLRKVCLAYGNLPNLVQLKYLISQEVKHITLGRKWVSNFIKRHNSRIIYGWDVYHNPIKFEDFKKWKNQFTFLWIWFEPLLQNTIRKCVNDGHAFYYLIRVPISYELLGSCFLCFKVSSDFKFSLVFVPEVITFRDNSSNMLHKEERVKILNRTLHSFCQRIPSDTKLIIFEGFDEQYRWELESCVQLVNIDNFVALPWGKHILMRLIDFGPELLSMNGPNNIKLSWEENRSSWPDIETDLKVFMTVSTDTSSTAAQLGIPSLPDFSPTANKSMDIEINAAASDDEDHHQQHRASGAANVGVTLMGQSNDHNPSTAAAAVAAAAATNAQKQTSPSSSHLQEQLKSIVTVIDEHERQLYNSMASQSSKVLLNTIFNRLREVVGDDPIR
ncbi:HFL113Wp [Eremothecium sinecaudum]|uniref:HFL113Wp n=1 Tax=Eremothecium sinecaudum TaxID=45286 RepID=A0A0X8HUP9_9SACH|nr:HFL113Wp [Eremothecium sinecaudum]AMD21743.1 HFL113Wp [Eremothecium sinecaudum]